MSIEEDSAPDCLTTRRLWLRRGLAGLLLVPAAGFLAGGRCHWHAHCDDDDFGDDDCDDDFDDDDFDDDDRPNSLIHDQDRSQSLRIERCRVEKSSEEDRYPIAALLEIEDVAAFGDGPGSLREAELRAFCYRVYEANFDRLGLAAGELAYFDCVFGPEAIELTWVQVFESPRPHDRRVGELVFVLDRLGRLREVHNSTWLR